MIRITAGELKGRAIRTQANDKTRPTHAKLRQAVFNSLQFEIPDAKILDLFSGSGALAFEALSRGAESAVLVESERSAASVIDANIKELGLRDRARLITADVKASLPRVLALGPYDIVFADPPYAAGWETKLLEEFPWGELLNEGGCLCLEWGVQKSQVDELPESAGILAKVREKRYGDSILTHYRR